MDSAVIRKIKAHRVGRLARNCHANLNRTRGMSYTDFPRNTLGREVPARMRSEVAAPIVEEATHDEIRTYCGQRVNGLIPLRQL